MSTTVVAIVIDKVQTFVYETIHVYGQKSQADDGTLSSIVNASNLISLEQGNVIKNAFKSSCDENPNKPDDFNSFQEILFCSGKYIFSTSLSKSTIEAKLKELFAKYYEDYGGQLFLNYTFFEHPAVTEEEKMSAIVEATRCLKSSATKNKVIESNKSLLFNFCNKQKDLIELTNKEDAEKNYPGFAKNINACFPKDEDTDSDTDKDTDIEKNKYRNEHHFRVAVIKADLDGMGSWFKSIKNFNVYKNVSEMLEKYVSLDNLHTIVESRSKKKKLNLYPLYMAGDDIFFIVPVSQILDGVEICKEILRNINKEIAKINKSESEQLPLLTVSIGIDFTFNREPIRYYYERVEKQIKMAKDEQLPAELQTMREKKNYSDLLNAKICINSYVFFDCNFTTLDTAIKELDYKGHLPNWHRFISAVKKLNHFSELLQKKKNDKSYAHHFFYGLLNKLEDSGIKENPQKYSNAILYHLIPKYCCDANKELREAEFELLSSILSQLLVKETKTKNKNVLSFEPDQIRAMQTYIRLLLLFSRDRFGMVKYGDDNIDYSIDSSSIKDNEDVESDRKRKESDRKMVFNKPLSYLYETSLVDINKSKKFRKIFVQKSSYSPKEKTKNQLTSNGKSSPQKVDVFRTLRLTGSMLYRLKNTRLKDTSKLDICTASKMIWSVNNKKQDEIKKIESLRKEEGKAPPDLFFDKDKFIEYAKKRNLWTEDFIDSLIVLYKLKDLYIKFKSLTK